jgi:DNA-binding transcriptional LysR family regulator
MHFDLTDLKIFVHIAESTSITKGAKKAFISAAAASVRIKEMEVQLSTKLLYRNSKGIELTPAGIRLLRHAKIILRQVEHLKTEFSSYSGSEFGHIRIYANTTATSEFLPDLLAYFLANSPGVTVDLQERQNNEIIRSVIDGTTDIGIVAGVTEVRNLRKIDFSTDELVIVCPQKHPMARRKSATFQDTLNYHHIGLHDGATIIQFLKEKANQLNELLNLRIQVSSFESIFRMVQAGVGVAIVPHSIYAKLNTIYNVKKLDLAEEWSTRQRSLLVRDISALPGCAIKLINKLLSDNGKPNIKN